MPRGRLSPVGGCAVNDLGSLIHRSIDDDGEIHVYEDAGRRYLTFGNRVEQSCVELARPARLAYAYTQAMMLALLLRPGARTALLLGLGGGSLARALRAYDRGLRITGVERRERVIEVARQLFGLPQDRRFVAVCDEAASYLTESTHRHDLVFADLYLAEGMDPRQVCEDFLRLCHDRLEHDGILVVNQWASEFSVYGEAAAAIEAVFGRHTLVLHAQGGNIITFAFAGQLPTLEHKALFADAQALGLRLDAPMQRHARNLWRQNAERLRIARLGRGADRG